MREELNNIKINNDEESVGRKEPVTILFNLEKSFYRVVFDCKMTLQSN